VTRLEVVYACGNGVRTRIIDVADDEEYWFEPAAGTNSLTVGKKGISPWASAAPHPAMHMTLSEWPRPRLHIFNLVSVEVLQ
jgi:hypothetical protein